MTTRITHTPAVLAAIALIAAKAIPREKIREGNYRSVLGSTDLFRHGYFVRHWLRFSDGSEILEYNPRLSDLPRVTATCYAEQIAIHRALGLNIVPPGVPWQDYGGRGLFDEILTEAAS